MVVELEFLRAELAAENKVIERLLLSQSILHDERLCSYKSPSGKVSAEGGVCGNRSINYCDKSVNTNETPLGQNQFIESNVVNDYIDVDTILKEISDSITRSEDLEKVNENADTNFNDMLRNNVQCVTANDAIVCCMMHSNV